MTDIVLASASAARRSILEKAGVSFSVDIAGVDEASVKESLAAERASGCHVAETLAELKAVRVSSRHPDRLVLGCDQVLEIDGRLFDKPTSMVEVREHLSFLSGKFHNLVTAVVFVENGQAVWRFVVSPRLKMRVLSTSFIDDYCERVGEAALSTVGAYKLEGLGAQLFERIDGDFFSILGLPLLQVLQFLRFRGVVPT